MSGVREPAVAGIFYPEDPVVLRDVADDLLAAAELYGPGKVLVVPHAGWRFSGPVAASAWASLRTQAGVIQRVVILGPSHRVPLAGMAVPDADEWDTPLGPIAIDRVARTVALDLPEVIRDDEPHRREHSIEVQLPFIQRALPRAKVLPIAVGQVPVVQIAAVIDALWGEEETVIAVSTDLSHFRTQAEAERLDQDTVALIERGDADALHGERACGFRGLQGLLRSRHCPRLRCIDRRTSADTAGRPERVVGYAAMVAN